MNTTKHSQQALLAAWNAMRGMDAYRHWPQDFDQVMSDPVSMRLVQIKAFVLARSNAKSQAPTYSAYRPRIQGSPSRAPLFDRKRAASGERDDD